jgi:membrane protease YdiL (CAAX protease family)
MTMTFDSVVQERRYGLPSAVATTVLRHLRSAFRWQRDDVLFTERQNRWRWPYALLGTVLAFGACFALTDLLIGLLDLIALWTDTTADLDVALSDTTWISIRNPYSFAAMVMLGATLALPVLLLALLHKRAWSFSFTYAVPFHWTEFLKGAGAVLVVYAGLQLVDFALDPHSYSLAVLPPHYLLWLAAAMAVLLVQTLGEELFFRGYLMRVWGAVLPVRALTVTPILLLFTMLHIGNADIGNNLDVIVLFAVGEWLYYWVLFRTRSVAVSWGMHWANNLFATLVATVPGYAPDLALVIYMDPITSTSESHLATGSVFTVLLEAVSIALLLLLFLWRRSPFYLRQPEAGAPCDRRAAQTRKFADALVQGRCVNA